MTTTNEPTVKPTRTVCPVAKDLLWKDRIHKEIAAAQNKGHVFNPLHTLDEEIEKIEDAKKRLGFTYIGREKTGDERRQDKRETCDVEDLRVTVPKTSAKIIGWLVNHPEFQYEIKEERCRPRYSIFKRLGWPIHRGF